ncbi:cyclic nucleotide-binding protein [Listeria fleischmannii 1991]|uniref:DNA-binding transcriptional dual regulator Crp n=2 Tax=Listeria fleischmannii TaxID=1069827 RepID=A0A2X3HDR9_9LIST|nr:Crp/Fnr family transcriptional regulator [Listeria fleischmannii]EMG28753.1 cyclic nucleotide-binding protein [Listeria fleischmannii subsp. fleischmannii LU2006-1]KMT58231.1 cyclic nucleotide-binding protein [Listeria fleischmannii 1991]SQC70471.1 DNA-binding transcriptional dual regulator Crp [Listeria fleischmannii subsp. fleischmannii]
MITTKDYATNLELKNLLEICYEHPKYNEKCTVLSTKKGDVLETHQSDGNKVYFILEGYFGIFIKNTQDVSKKTSKPAIIRFLQKEDTFGLPNLFSNNWESKASLQSLGNGKVMAVDSVFLNEILEKIDPKRNFILGQMDLTIKESRDFAELSFYKKEERIRKALLKCANVLGTFSPNGILLPKEITQEVLARYTSTSREYVACTIQLLTKKNMVRNKPKPLLILDKNKL